MDTTFPSSPCSATLGPADGEKGSEAETDPGPIFCLLGLEEGSWAGRGSGGLGGGGELGMGNDGSSGAKGSGGEQAEAALDREMNGMDAETCSR